MKTCLKDIKDFLCKNHLKKKQKLRNLTCVYIALKPIQVDSRIILAIISD